MASNLSYFVIIEIMNASLVQVIDSVLVIAYSFINGYSHFHESNAGSEAFLFKYIFADNVSALEYLAVLLFQFLNQLLRLSRSKTTEELNLIVHVLMLNDKVDVDADFVQELDVDLLENVHQTSLVDVLLHWMQSQVQRLIFTHDRTPKVQYLVHWVLLVPGKADGFLKDEWMILQKLLTVMRGCKQLWNLWTTPNHECLIVIHVRVNLIFLDHIVVHIIWINLVLGEIRKVLFEFSRLQAVRADNNKINFMLAEDFLELSYCFIVLCLFTIILVLTHLLTLLIRPLLSCPRRNQMQEVLMTLEVAVLVHDGHRGHVITIIDWMKNRAHDCNPLALRDDLIIDLVRSLLVALIWIIITNCEVACLDHVSVLFTALLDHVVLGFFLQFFFNFVNDTLYKRLLNFTRNHIIVLAENALDFFSASTPFILLLVVDSQAINGEVTLDLLAHVLPLIELLGLTLEF